MSGGCATASKPAAARVGEQEQAMVELRAKNAGYVRKIEELENRIFILEDQLDSRKLAAEQKAPAILPARTLRAGARETGKSRDAKTAAGARVTAPAPEESAVETSIVAEHAVDYTGEAAETGSVPPPATDGRRPMLRLSSTSASVPRERLRVVEAAAPEPGGDARDSSATRTAPESLGGYRRALDTLRAGHPDVALAAFKRFLDGNPQHDYADNAQYWIGECLYDQQQFRAAERAFRTVVERYPHGNKVPDAMLKLGFTLQSLGDEAQGRAVLESLARAFPKHEAARLASERLAHPEAPPPRAGQSPTFGTVLPAVGQGTR